MQSLSPLRPLRVSEHWPYRCIELARRVLDGSRLPDSSPLVEGRLHVATEDARVRRPMQKEPDMKLPVRTTFSARFIFACICCTPVGLSVSGCENLPAKQAETVKAGFTEKESCGEVTVAATSAPDWLRDRRPPPPPTEIAADPTRSAIYYKNHIVKTYSGLPMYLAEGCGHSDLWVCGASGPCPDGTLGCSGSTYCVWVRPPMDVKESAAATPSAPPPSLAPSR
jgi:hypothetical protein